MGCNGWGKIGSETGGEIIRGNKIKAKRVKWKETREEKGSGKKIWKVDGIGYGNGLL